MPGCLRRTRATLPGQTGVQLLVSGIEGGAGSGIRRLLSLIRPVEMRDLSTVIAIHYEGGRNYFRAGGVQEPQQQQAMPRHRPKGCAWLLTNTTLERCKHCNRSAC